MEKMIENGRELDPGGRLGDTKAVVGLAGGQLMGRVNRGGDYYAVRHGIIHTTVHYWVGTRECKKCKRARRLSLAPRSSPDGQASKNQKSFPQVPAQNRVNVVRLVEGNVHCKGTVFIDFPRRYS